MNRTEHLLTVVSEECHEIILMLSEIVSHEDVVHCRPSAGLDSSDRAAFREFEDLIGVIEMLHENGDIKEPMDAIAGRPSSPAVDTEALGQETNKLVGLAIQLCCHVGQRASKASRFGMREIQPGQFFTNAQRLVSSYQRLCQVMAELGSRYGIEISRERVEAKKLKVTKFMLYASELGALNAN